MHKQFLCFWRWWSWPLLAVAALLRRNRIATFSLPVVERLTSVPANEWPRTNSLLAMVKEWVKKGSSKQAKAVLQEHLRVEPTPRPRPRKNFPCLTALAAKPAYRILWRISCREHCRILG